MKRTVKWWRGPSKEGMRYAWLPTRVGDDLVWFEWYPDYLTARAILVTLLRMPDEEFGRIKPAVFEELMAAYYAGGRPRFGNDRTYVRRLVREQLRKNRAPLWP